MSCSVAAWNAWRGVVPQRATMAIIGLLALFVNVAVAVLLIAAVPFYFLAAIGLP